MTRVGEPSRDPPVVIASQGGANKPTATKNPEEETLRKILDDYVEHSSMHGIWKAAKTSPFSRAVWTVVLLCMICLCLFTFVSQLLFFLQFKTNTLVTVIEQPFLPFPAVTVCNYNSFRKSKALEKPSITKVLEQLFSLDRIFHINVYTTSTDEQSDDVDILKELIDLAHTLEGMVVYCFWCGMRVDCKQHFVQTMTDVGVCYTFNSKNTTGDTPMLVRDAGSDCGLKLILNIQRHEYFYGQGDSTGVKVLVHDPKEVPLVGQQGFSAAPGTTVIASIKLQQELYAASPYGDCVDVSKRDFKNPLQYHDEYTYTGCKMEHRVNYIYSSCHCVQYFHPVGGREICTTFDQVECSRKAQENHTMYQLEQLSQDCPVTCEYNTFDEKLSWASFPAQHILDDLQTTFNMSAQAISDNLVQLHIYYENLAVHRQEQTPAYTVGALFADTGGEMGLCIGASLLTVVELFELCGHLAAFSWKKITRHMFYKKPRSSLSKPI